MKAKQVIFSGVTATSFMTAFSYILSDGKDKNFKEPELLASLLENGWPELEKEYSTLAGWGVHYGLGLIWAMAHNLVIEKTNVKPTGRSALMLGFLGGLTGIIIWKLLFQNNPQPPQIKYRSFYGHMVLAQMIFTMTVIMLHKKEKTNYLKG